mgnify:CR=1 FL=1
MKRILVIDDDDLTRATIRDMLETSGYEVDEAENGSDGVLKQQDRPFDLIVTDVLMPDKDGIETIIDLKRGYPNLRIIAISGGGTTGNLVFLEMSTRFGADKMLAKPFSNLQLLDAVESLLTTR